MRLVSKDRAYLEVGFGLIWIQFNCLLEGLDSFVLLILAVEVKPETVLVTGG